MPEISSKVVLPILGVVALVILSYFLNQMFGSFGQLNYLTMDHCQYQGERFLSVVQRTNAAHSADDAWNADGRTVFTLEPQTSGACHAAADMAVGAYYTPNGRLYNVGTLIDVSADADVPSTKSNQTLAIMESNAGILRLIIQALPLLAAIGILSAGYLWYKGGFGPAKVSG